MKKLLETRPYEKEKGKTDQVYQSSLKRVCEAIQQRGDLEETLEEGLEDFNQIEVEKPGTKSIGIVGENSSASIGLPMRMSSGKI